MTCLCGRAKGPNSNLCVVCYRQNRSAAKLRVCVGCGSEFLKKNTGGNKGLYCSRQCTFNDPVRREMLVARMARVTAERLPEIEAGKVLTANRRAEAQAQKRRLSLARKTAREQQRQDIAIAMRRVLTCPSCGSEFRRSPKRKYCSERCLIKTSKRINKGVRRARQRKVQVEPVNPLVVFRRDGWRCQLCGVKTRKQHANTPDSPELDHIVPLSIGGAHSYDNTQCLCRACNGKKGARIAGQLRLCG